MSLPDGQLGSALSSPVETGRPLLQQRTPPERVSPPRQDVTPYTAAKDHVRRLERSRGTRRGRSFMADNEQHNSGFGGKNIGYFAGIALLINNITGPGVPQLPNQFAESGWLVPTLVIVAIWLMTSLSTVMYCEAMRRIPGNEQFRGRIEFTTIVKYYFGQTSYVCAQVGINGALQSLNIISVIQSAQVMDNAISAIWGSSCALNVAPFLTFANGTALPESTELWTCMDSNSPADGSIAGNPWGCHVVVSLGFVVTFLVTLPMGYFNLDDNMIIQVGAFVLTLLCWAVWIAASLDSPAFHEGSWRIPALNGNPATGSQAAVLGTILFNFGFVTTVPSWVNEKKPHVSVNKTVWLSTFCCNLVFFAIGVVGCMAWAPHLAGPATNSCSGGDCAQSLMSVLTDPAHEASAATARPGLRLSFCRGSDG